MSTMSYRHRVQGFACCVLAVLMLRSVGSDASSSTPSITSQGVQPPPPLPRKPTLSTLPPPPPPPPHRSSSQLSSTTTSTATSDSASDSNNADSENGQASETILPPKPPPRPQEGGDTFSNFPSRGSYNSTNLPPPPPPRPVLRQQSTLSSETNKEAEAQLQKIAMSISPPPQPKFDAVQQNQEVTKTIPPPPPRPSSTRKSDTITLDDLRKLVRDDSSSKSAPTVETQPQYLTLTIADVNKGRDDQVTSGESPESTTKEELAKEKPDEHHGSGSLDKNGTSDVSYSPPEQLPHIEGKDLRMDAKSTQSSSGLSLPPPPPPRRVPSSLASSDEDLLRDDRQENQVSSSQKDTENIVKPDTFTSCSPDWNPQMISSMEAPIKHEDGLTTQFDRTHQAPPLDIPPHAGPPSMLQQYPQSKTSLQPPGVNPNQRFMQQFHQQQQQQQQQQQPKQRTPARALQPQQQSRRPPPSKSSAHPARALWSRVEKGLDELANLEDSVTGRANSFVTSVLPEAWRRQQRSPTQHRKKPLGKLTGQRRAPVTEVCQPFTPQLRWKHQRLQEEQDRQKSESNPTVETFCFQETQTVCTSTSQQPGEAQGLDGKSFPPRGTAGTNTNIDWGDIMTNKTKPRMPANGGASSPPGWNQDVRPGMRPASFDPRRPSDSTGKDAMGVFRGQTDGAPVPPVVHSAASQSVITASPPRPQQPRYAEKNPGSGSMSRERSPQAGNREGQQRRGPPWQTDPQRPTPTSRPNEPARMGSSRVRPYQDDDDEQTGLSRLLSKIPIPRLPSFGKLFRFGRRSDDFDYASLDAWAANDNKEVKSGGIFGLFRRRQTVDELPTLLPKPLSRQGSLPRPIASLVDRCDKGKSSKLLAKDDRKIMRGLGKSKAVFDAITLCFTIYGIRQLQGLETIPIPRSIHELGALTAPAILAVLQASLDTWAPFAFAAAVLMVNTNSLLFDRRIASNAADVGKSVHAETIYGGLYMRLVSSSTQERYLSDKLSNAARLQALACGELARLQSFVTYMVALIVLMTVAAVRPLVLTILEALLQVVGLEEWRSLPIRFSGVMANARDIFGASGRKLRALVEVELSGAGHHPMRVAFKASILAVLLLVSLVPLMEHRRKIPPNEDTDEEDAEEMSTRVAEHISKLGASSAGRLLLLAKSGWVEGTLDRWRVLQSESPSFVNDVSARSLLRYVGSRLLTWFLLASPVLVFGFLLDVPVGGVGSGTMPKWEALLEVVVLLMFTNNMARNALSKVFEASNMCPGVVNFLQSIARTVDEMSERDVSPRQMMNAANPSTGLVVRDFWAAHTAKRAWAVRGANLNCRNGEILVLLGDDGAGKSRLLTALAELVVAPPRRALTSTRVRGNVAVGGIDIDQWDRSVLQRRVGVFVNDVRTLSDTADLWSGLSVEEILEPGHDLKFSDPSHTSGALEKACMLLALKITGLYSTLLPRLPSKLATILTSKEEDLRPSSLRPRYTVLSPTEWSKLLLAKLIAQAVYDNDNSSASADKLENSLIGSLLLLDDAAVLLSETDETKLLSDLRSTGAAIVLTSNKWATGRLADRIAVVKDGAIVESGSHAELLNRGPQHSLYAAKWNAMTAQ